MSASPPPFRFPRSAAERLLAPLAAAERTARALVRLLRHRELPHRGRRSVAPAPAPASDVILYLPALPWDYRYQRPQQLAAALAAEGSTVLYIDPFGRGRLQPSRRMVQLDDRLFRLHLSFGGRYDPFRETLPAETACDLAAEISDALRAPAQSIIAQLPSWNLMARELRQHLGCYLVYDRIDLHASFPDVPQTVIGWEEEIIAAADLVTATSPDLANKSAPAARRVAVLPNAVALADFPFRKRPTHRPPDRLRVGYVGALHEWFDADALAAAAEERPQWTFELAGRVEHRVVSSLRRFRNVTLHGEIPYHRVARFLADLDVSLVPFKDVPLTRAVDPVKLYEAFAVGVPVVARNLPGVTKWPEPLVFTYERSGELAAQVTRAATAGGEEARARRRQIAEGQTWRRRARSLREMITQLERPRPPA